MISVLKDLKESVLIPIKSIKAKYIPLLMIYFAYGLYNILSIGLTFWMKNELKISNLETISIAVWATFPWSAKIIFGQLMDSVRIFGNLRKSYAYLGACFVLIGNFILIAFANKFPFISEFSAYNILSIYTLITAIGMVTQDMVADTLCLEVVDTKEKDGTKRDEEDVKQEIATIQVLGRMFVMGSLFIGAYIGGQLATYMKFADSTWLILIIPFISIIGITFVKSKKIKPIPIEKTIFLGGIFFVVISIIVTLSNSTTNQEIMFCMSLLLFIFLLVRITKKFSKEARKHIFIASIVIFTFRMTPNYGAAINWWQIDVLGFDAQFLAYLSQIGLILGFIATWLFSKYLVKARIASILLLLNFITVIIQLPMIGMAYGLHEWTEANFGFGARTIAIIDASIETPFISLSMIPLGVICAYYAPKEGRATWFALTASIMNLALVGANLLSKLIANIYVVERGKYENIPAMMISSTLLTLLIPTITIFIFMNPFSKEKNMILK